MGFVKNVWCRYSLILLLENILSKIFWKSSGRFFSIFKFPLSRRILLKTALMSLDLSNCFENSTASWTIACSGFLENKMSTKFILRMIKIFLGVLSLIYFLSIKLKFSKLR